VDHLQLFMRIGRKKTRNENKTRIKDLSQKIRRKRSEGLMS